MQGGVPHQGGLSGQLKLKTMRATNSQRLILLLKGNVTKKMVFKGTLAWLYIYLAISAMQIMDVMWSDEDLQVRKGYN